LDFRGPPSQEPVDQIKAIFDVNVFGPVRVTQAFLPLLNASAAARIVMMSSGLGSIGMALDPGSEFHAVNLLGYNSSKTALNAVTVAFAKELSPFGIKVNAADPGYAATDLNGNRGPQRRTGCGDRGAAGHTGCGRPDGGGSSTTRDGCHGDCNDRGPAPW
jgi:NAD(P)-dependent dehydrogenase (short-subunit alcohol dehydrogenase family)